LKNTFVSIVDQPKSFRLSRSHTFDCSSCHDNTDANSLVEFEVSSDLSRDGYTSCDFADLAQNEATVMLRNIPNRYTEEWLVEEIDAVVSGCDFVYLPINFNKKNTNLGYAFVNFQTAAAAEVFMAEFEGHQFHRQPRSLKRAQISLANVQGKEANIKQVVDRADGSLKFWVR
jgi:RNA recognition motif-containing protein